MMIEVTQSCCKFQKKTYLSKIGCRLEEIGNIAKRPVKANLWGGGYEESRVSAPQAGHQ